MVENADSQRSFGLVPHVKIQTVDDQNVSFATRSASQSGDASESLLRTFTVPRTEVYTAPIPGAPTSVAMQSGALGPLYLSSQGWKTTSGGYGIYGASHADAKYPQNAAVPAPPLTRLTVVPTSIRVHGHLEGATSFFEIELLGPDGAEAQDILWNSADYVELRLTEHGARRFHGKSHATRMKVWPTKIVIKGSPAIDRTISGKVDILDGELADSLQRLTFAKHGAPIALRLTQDGVDAFHVTPQAIAEQSNDLEHTPPPKAA
jgi:hypothetical protein